MSSIVKRLLSHHAAENPNALEWTTKRRKKHRIVFRNEVETGGEEQGTKKEKEQKGKKEEKEGEKTKKEEKLKPKKEQEKTFDEMKVLALQTLKNTDDAIKALQEEMMRLAQRVVDGDYDLVGIDGVNYYDMYTMVAVVAEDFTSSSDEESDTVSSE